MTEEILPGYCQCGCGRRTSVARKTCTDEGIKKGEHRRYVQGHRRDAYAARADGTKACSQCKRVLSLENFSPRPDRIPNRRSACKPCESKLTHRIYGLKTRYGITEEQYEKLLNDQNGLCAICDKPETEIHLGKVKRLAIDHCHTANKVRALLCGKCNKLIGLGEENPVILRRAAEYLDEHKI